MIQFVCDTCSAVKAADDVWVLGLAAESLGVAAARREVTILPVWDRTRAVHPLAVHFCSLECKDEYMAALFGPESPEEEVIIERAAPVDGEAIVKRTTVTSALRRNAVRTSTQKRQLAKSRGKRRAA